MYAILVTDGAAADDETIPDADDEGNDDVTVGNDADDSSATTLHIATVYVPPTASTSPT